MKKAMVLYVALGSLSITGCQNSIQPPEGVQPANLSPTPTASPIPSPSPAEDHVLNSTPYSEVFSTIAYRVEFDSSILGMGYDRSLSEVRKRVFSVDESRTMVGSSSSGSSSPQMVSSLDDVVKKMGANDTSTVDAIGFGPRFQEKIGALFLSPYRKVLFFETSGSGNPVNLSSGSQTPEYSTELGLKGLPPAYGWGDSYVRTVEPGYYAFVVDAFDRDANCVLSSDEFEKLANSLGSVDGSTYESKVKQLKVGGIHRTTYLVTSLSVDASGKIVDGPKALSAYVLSHTTNYALNPGEYSLQKVYVGALPH